MKTSWKNNNILKKLKEDSAKSYTLCAWNTHDEPEYVTFRLWTDKLGDCLNDTDANYDCLELKDGEYFEISYNDESMYMNKCDGPQDIYQKALEIAKEQWDNDEYDTVYFEDYFGGTELEKDDFDSPEDLTEYAYNLYYEDSEVDSDSSSAQEIIQFNHNNYEVGTEGLFWDDEEEDFEERRKSKRSRI